MSTVEQQANDAYRDIVTEGGTLTPTLTLYGTETLEEAQKQFVLLALRVNGGNRTHTAERLDISTRTLQRWLIRWGVS